MIYVAVGLLALAALAALLYLSCVLEPRPRPQGDDL